MSNNRNNRGIFLVVIIIISAFIGAGIHGQYEQKHPSTNLSTEKKIAASESRLISQIARTAGASVVSVNVNITTGGAAKDGFGLFEGSTSEQTQGAGTGIIISSKGIIITNRHVVPRGTTKISVTLSDGTEIKNVAVVGRTNDSDSLDVAFLKINDAKGHKLPAANIGDSADVQVGDNVVAIGNALGQFQNTVTSGIISGFGRSVQAGDRSGDLSATENLDNLFQTDAAINEGNSGGPLVNLDGEVIGINTAIAGNAQNIGFAIPINDVKGLIDQVIKTGKFARPYLGVRYIPLTADIASQFDLRTTNGAFVIPADNAAESSVVPDSPAAKAGIQERDIIVAVDGRKIDAAHSLISRLAQHKPGDKVKLTIVRGDKTLQFTAKLDVLPSTE